MSLLYITGTVEAARQACTALRRDDVPSFIDMYEAHDLRELHENTPGFIIDYMQAREDIPTDAKVLLTKVECPPLIPLRVRYEDTENMAKYPIAQRVFKWCADLPRIAFLRVPRSTCDPPWGGSRAVEGSDDVEVSVIRAVLPLNVPGHCYLGVGSEVRALEVGRLELWDGRQSHFVANEAESGTLVLLDVDVRRPPHCACE